MSETTGSPCSSIRRLVALLAVVALVVPLLPAGSATADDHEPPPGPDPAHAVELVSVSPDGEPADASAQRPSVSADARFVAFDAAATNLVPGVDDGIRQVYVRDRQAGTTELISHNAEREPGDAESRGAGISDDGRYVVFESVARNLLPEATSAHRDIYLRDRQTGTLSLLSEYAGQPSRAASRAPAISADGRYVTWIEWDTWGNPEWHNAGHIWRRELATGAMRMVSYTPDGRVFPTNKWDPQISGDGSVVTFQGVLHTQAGIHGAYNLYAWRELLLDAGGRTLRSGALTAPACPEGSVPPAPFDDVEGSTHRAAIDCLVELGVARGVSDTAYAPARSVRRDQMASFLVRLVELLDVELPTGEAGFVDIAGTTHEAAILRLAAAGIVRGVDDEHYAPARTVTRAQMATFLVRTYEAVTGTQAPTPEAGFTDIAGTAHETSILAVAGLGVARGVTDTTYAPAADVRRDQMASFLVRLLDRLLDEVPGEPDEPIEVDEVDPVSVEVDETLAPQVPETVPHDDGAPRELVAVVDEVGNQADVVADELLVVGGGEVLDAFLARWDAEVLRSLDLTALDDDLLPVHLVRVDPTQGDASVLDQREVLGDEPVFGAHTVGSPAALGLLAISAAEADVGVDVALNVVSQPDGAGVDYVHGPIADAPAGPAMAGVPYDPDPRTWRHFASGTTQDIGVADAWRRLALAGLTDPPADERVRIAVLDGGFADLDLPPGSVGANDLPGDFATCGGSPCPWHGTAVTQTAVGVPGNGFGAAGTGGPVATATMIGVSAAPDSFTLIELSVGLLDLVGNQRPRILNMSFSGSVPRLLAIPLEKHVERLFSALLLADVLPIASAGNLGEDVNEQVCMDLSAHPLLIEDVVCYERSRTWPCQADAVLCIGGLEADARSQHPGSNFGADVALWAPYVNYAGPDPTAPDSNEAILTTGTSGAAPFVSGVAALVMAADPSLSARRVGRLLLASARDGQDEVARYVQARTAVAFALEGPFEVVWVSARPDGEATDGATRSSGGGGRGHASLTADGGRIMFTSTASDQLGGPSATSVYVYDLASGLLAAGTEPSTSGTSWDWASLSTSADGRFTAFATWARRYGLPPDCVERPLNASYLFVHDEDTGQTSWISATVDGAQPNRSSNNPDVSADGSRVAFDSGVRDLIDGLDPGDADQVFLAPLPGRRCDP